MPKVSISHLRLSAKHSIKEEVLTLDFDSELKGNVLLEIEFNGILNDKMAGFYRSQYECDGVKK